jgi:hypothetical protein
MSIDSTIAARARHGNAVSAGRPRYTDATLIAALRDAAVDGYLSATMYRAYYEARIGIAPADRTITMRFGSWNAAIDAAGLSHGTANRTYTRTSRTDLAEGVAAVMVALGRVPTLADYEIYRATASVPLVGSAIIRQRFGSWPAALVAAAAVTS